MATCRADEVTQIMSGKLALKYMGKNADAMKAIAQASKDRSLADFKKVLMLAHCGGGLACAHVPVFVRWCALVQRQLHSIFGESLMCLSEYIASSREPFALRYVGHEQ